MLRRLLFRFRRRLWLRAATRRRLGLVSTAWWCRLRRSWWFLRRRRGRWLRFRLWRLWWRLWWLLLLRLLWLILWFGFVLRRRRLLLWFVFWLRLILRLGFLLRFGLLLGLWLGLLSFIDLFIFFFIVANALHENLLITEVVLAHLVRIFLLRRRWSRLWRCLGLRCTTRG